MKFRKSRVGIADSNFVQNIDKKSTKQICSKSKKKKKLEKGLETSESFESSTSITCFLAGLLWILKLLRLRKKQKVSPSTKVEPHTNTNTNSEEVLLDKNVIRSLSPTDIEDILTTKKIDADTIKELKEISRTPQENLTVCIPKSTNLIQPATNVNEQNSFVLQGRMMKDQTFRLIVRSSGSNIKRWARSRAAKSFTTFRSDMFDVDQLANNVKSIAVHYHISSQDLVYLHATFVDSKSEALIIFPPELEFDEFDTDLLEYYPVPRLDLTELDDTNDDSETSSLCSTSSMDICFFDRQIEKQRIRHPDVPKLDLSQLGSEDEGSDSESGMSSQIKQIPRLSDLCLSVINKLVVNYEANTFDSTDSSKISSPTVKTDMNDFKPKLKKSGSSLMAPRAPKEKSALDDMTPFVSTSNQISMNTTYQLQSQGEGSASQTSGSIVEPNSTKGEQLTIDVIHGSNSDEEPLQSSSNIDTELEKQKDIGQLKICPDGLNKKLNDQTRYSDTNDKVARPVSSRFELSFQHDSPTKEHVLNSKPQILESMNNGIENLAPEETIDIPKNRSARSVSSASSCIKMQMQKEEGKQSANSISEFAKDPKESSNNETREKVTLRQLIKFNEIPDIMEFKISKNVNDGYKEDFKNPVEKYKSNVYGCGDRRRRAKNDEFVNNKTIEQYSPEVQKFCRKGRYFPEKPKPRIIGMPTKRAKVKFDNRIEVLRPEMPNCSIRSKNRPYKYFETVDEKEQEIDEEIVGEGNDDLQTDQVENCLLDLASCDNRVLRVKKHQIGGHIYPRTQNEIDAREKLKKEKLKKELAELRKRHILLDDEEEEDIEQYYTYEEIPSLKNCWFNKIDEKSSNDENHLPNIDECSNEEERKRKLNDGQTVKKQKEGNISNINSHKGPGYFSKPQPRRNVQHDKFDMSDKRGKVSLNKSSKGAEKYIPDVVGRKSGKPVNRKTKKILQTKEDIRSPYLPCPPKDKPSKEQKRRIAKRKENFSKRRNNAPKREKDEDPIMRVTRIYLSNNRKKEKKKDKTRPGEGGLDKFVGQLLQLTGTKYTFLN